MIKLQIKFKSGEIKHIMGKTWRITQYLHQIKEQILFFDKVTSNNLHYDII